ncbi:MAG: aminomethyl-transferring glycine dehydrogenase subunit GcvPB, partial [Rickettsiales bacterium]|nr:aminomethyl-transferring glycine dehydrogenase subunit GcvPB [Rickettsiales bacterium]
MSKENRGLNFEEPLLFELSRKGALGVDLPEVDYKEPRTGLKVRETIGLPEVTEPEVVQHFVRLSQKNYSIDTGFYPLGSCTMKHNPRLNEHVARYKGFAQIHPLQPDEQIQGALHVIHEVQYWLGELTGLKNVTLNPAAGAQGEMAGMMVVRKAHLSRGSARRVVLVPDSAHGTNPATARACGYEIKTIPTIDGETDFQALEAAMSDEVAALMLTNPNTCGLFEAQAKKIADLIHHYGAYFYCDGANFNALVGKIRPVDFGVDVMHINLHKTFSTPHGGGGPGSGPIAVSDALAPYLPVPKVIKNEQGQYERIYPETS